jgi:hypothetical protein
MDVGRLMAEDDAGWTALHDAFASIPADRFEDPSVTPEGWSPKDVMFHVAYWMADCAHVLERIRVGSWDGGQDETPAATDATNAEGFERSRDMDPADVRASFAASHQQMCEAMGHLDTMTTEAWEWFEESGPLHYAKHVDDLRTWLEA